MASKKLKKKLVNKLQGSIVQLKDERENKGKTVRDSRERDLALSAPASRAPKENETGGISRSTSTGRIKNVTKEERKHRERMLEFARKQANKKPLTPHELADAIQDLKKKHPDFPPSLRK